MNEEYTTYSEHYKRMLNERPLRQLINFDYSAYTAERPWITLLDRNKPVLDIGCGYGHQLYMLHRLGFTNLTGIEITETSYKIAAEEVGSFAQIYLADAFEFLEKKQEVYSVITLNDVLEHIPRDKTIELLRAIQKSLAPEGVLSVRVPNMSSLLSAYSMYLDFTHLVGFTEFSLMQVLDLAGFTDHQVVRKKRKIQLRRWRPWSPLRGLGLTSLVNDYLHNIFYRLRGQTPLPTVFDYNIEVWTRKRQ